MIDFNGMKRTEEETFFFFPSGLQDELTHFMNLAGISNNEFEILTYAETQERYPDMQIPLVPSHPALNTFPETFRKPLTMISHMNPEDLERKLWEIHKSEEAIRWNQQIMDEIITEEQKRNERLKGWGPGLTRENEDVK